MMLRFAAAILLLPLPALAHHPLGGAVPATWWEGLASGIGHPMIGLDHLAFLLAAGALAGLLPAREGIASVLLFVAAAFLGTVAHVLGVGFAPVPMLVALTTVGAGMLLFAGATPRRLWALFPLAGLFHGHAFAEAVLGAEPTPVLAYLAGLALTQAALGFAALILSRRLARRASGLVLRRAVGAAAAAVGVLFLAAAVAEQVLA